MRKSKLYQILSLIIFFVLGYRYLILEYIPYHINEDVSVLTLFFVMIGLLMHLLHLRSIAALLQKKKTSKIQGIIHSILEKFYYGPLKRIGESLLQSVFINTRVLEIAYILEIFLRTKPAIYLFVYLVYFLPKFTVAYSLIADVFFLNKIHVFYEYLWLMIIPLFFQAICGLISLSIEKEKSKLEQEFVQIKPITMVIILKPKYVVSESYFKQNTALLLYYVNIIDFLNAINLSKRHPRFLQAIAVCINLFIFGWFTFIARILFLQLYFLW